ncbi:MAG TPA: hypothetical protein PKA63_03675 [Oligoflexia bacterium]|nr:hypothetical protein [Oligoflexia bacterium]HMP47754.1 hypothetical protein [Oligoflexia bacterium]
MNSFKILKLSLLFAVLVFTISACTKKDENESSESNTAKNKISDSKTADPYEVFLSGLEKNSLAGMLPAGTFGFVIFMNQNNTAKKQKDYWENDLPADVRDLVKQTMAGLEKILDEAGVLEGKKIDEVYEMESAQFVAELSSDNSASTDSKKPKNEIGSGFIARFKIEKLENKAKDIAGSLSRSGYPATVLDIMANDSPYKNISSKGVSVIEFSQDSSFLSGFRYLALKGGHVVFASSPALIVELSSIEGSNGLPGIFRDPQFRETAERLSHLDTSVIFGGAKGSLNTEEVGFPLQIPGATAVIPGSPDSSAGSGIDTQLHDFFIRPSAGADAVTDKPMILAFNQSFDGHYRAEFRSRLSGDLLDSHLGSLLSTTTNGQTSSSKSEEKSSDSIPSNGILLVDFPPQATSAILTESEPLLMMVDPAFSELVPLVKGLALTVSATEGQQSFLPFPALGIRVELSDVLKGRKLLEELILRQLESASLIPPATTWAKDTDETKSLLTALGEQLTIVSAKKAGDSGIVALSSSRDQAKYLAGDIKSLKPDMTENQLALRDFIPQISHSQISRSVKNEKSDDAVVIDVLKLFLNFKAMNTALEKVFTMSAIFGEDVSAKHPSGSMDPKNLGKTLSAIGASGIRIYIEKFSNGMVDSGSESQTTSGSRAELVVKAQAKKIN